MHEMEWRHEISVDIHALHEHSFVFNFTPHLSPQKLIFLTSILNPLFYKKVISSSTVTKLIIGFPFGPTITLLNVSDIFSRASQLELNENLDLLQNPGGIFSESM